MSKTLISYDPFTRTSIYHSYDHVTRQTTIETSQDCGPIIEQNKQEFVNADFKKQVKEGWWKVATIPTSVILKWKVEKGIDIYNPDHIVAVNKMLNDPEWLYLRTCPGKV